MAKTRAKTSASPATATATATVEPKPAARKAASRKPTLPKPTASVIEDGDQPVSRSASSRNGKLLVIVESPAKAKTINKYLGDDYIVKASMGHVRDLPSKGMGVDLETFQPDYVLIEERGKDKLVTELKKLAKNSELVYLATDLDREGEAIAWHLKEALGVSDDRARRVIFNAITKPEIQRAFAQPKSIDMDRVNAQQARRILDRIVGYEISPLLWRKVAKGLSAGRVQSVAVRLVVEREREIGAFVPEEFWKIGGIFTADASDTTCTKLAAEWHNFLKQPGNGDKVSGDKVNGEKASGEKAAGTPAIGPTKAERERWLTDHNAFAAELVELSGKKFDANNKADARRAAELLGFVLDRDETTEDKEAKGPAQHATRLHGHTGNCPRFSVRSIEKKRSTSRPPAPFITSTLQQGAASRLHMAAKRTMQVAQGLYEAGHITYMRTDSTHLSGDALTMARKFIDKKFGQKYLPEKPNFFTSSNKSAQEAHEAIRPTDVTFTPEMARAKLGSDDARLYDLVWRRFVACQMSPAEFDQTAVVIVTATPEGDAVFRATGRKLVFDGFMKVAGISSEDQLLPDLKEQQPVFPIEIDPTQHFTQPPPRYTEASLVKMLEQLGIGRPSTYASIIQTIQDRQYVQQQDRRFYATLLGTVVTDKLVQAFPEILDVKFTAGMELKLDEVEEHQADWVKVLRDFYGPFHATVAGSLENIEHAGGAPSPYPCPKCGKPLLYRISKNGFFLACSDRECATTVPVDAQGKPTLREVSEYKCPNCGREMMKRKGRFGEFLGCTGYSVKNEKGEPSCSTIINLDKEGKPLPPKPPPIKTTVACEKCGNPMLLRDSKRGPFLGCSTFPKCRSTKMMKKLIGDDLKQVEALIPLLKEGGVRAAEMAAKITGSMPASTPARPTNVTTDIDCDECGKPMIIRQGRRGPFLGCSGYPKCKNTGEVPAKLLEEMGVGPDGKPISKEDAGKAKAEVPADTDVSEDVPVEA